MLGPVAEGYNLNNKKNLGCLGFFGDEILPGYVGVMSSYAIMRIHIKQPGFNGKQEFFFFRGSPVINCQEGLGKLNKAIIITSWFIGGGGGGSGVQMRLSRSESIDSCDHIPAGSLKHSLDLNHLELNNSMTDVANHQVCCFFSAAVSSFTTLFL